MTVGAGRLGGAAAAAGALVLALVLGHLVATDSSGAPIGLLLVSAGACVVVFYIHQRADFEDRRFLSLIFTTGLVLRVLLALLINRHVPHGFFALDDGVYNQVGRQLAEHWQTGAPYPAYIATTRQVGYHYVNGAITYLFSFSPLIPVMMNGLIGALTPVFVFFIGKRLFDRRSAWWAAVLTEYFPSLVLWSSLNLKDSFAVFLIVLVIWFGVILYRQVSLWPLFGAVTSILALYTLRSYLVLLVTGGVVLAFATARLGRRFHSHTIGLLVLALFIWIAHSFDIGGSMVDPESLKTVAGFRQGLAFGGSAYYGEVDISTTRKALQFLPIGLLYFLFGPAPWLVGNLRQFLTLPEMLIWYALIPFVFRGLRRGLRGQARAVLIPLAVMIILSVAYALVEANLGTAYRHRAQVLPLFLLFAGGGIAAPRLVRQSRLALGGRPEGASSQEAWNDMRGTVEEGRT